MEQVLILKIMMDALVGTWLKHFPKSGNYSVLQTLRKQGKKERYKRKPQVEVYGCVVEAVVRKV